MNYIKLEPNKSYGIELPDGSVLRLDVVDSDEYPGLDIELISKDDKRGESRPRILIEKPFDDCLEKYDTLRALIWSNPKNEDYTHEINFEK